MQKEHLFDHYYVAEVDADQWYHVFTAHHQTVFPHENSPSLLGLLSEAERAKQAALQQNLAQAIQLYYLLLADDEPIGWHFGLQRSELEYFMANTGLLPAYQNRGIYSAFLRFIIGRAADAGFQFLTSIHHSDNNAVLVPKLKAGFLIQSFGYLIQTMLPEANHGPMIQLVYPVKPDYRQFFGFQRGLSQLQQGLQQLPPAP